MIEIAQGGAGCWCFYVFVLNAFRICLSSNDKNTIISTDGVTTQHGNGHDAGASPLQPLAEMLFFTPCRVNSAFYCRFKVPTLGALPHLRKMVDAWSTMSAVTETLEREAEVIPAVAAHAGLDTEAEVSAADITMLEKGWESVRVCSEAEEQGMCVELDILEAGLDGHNDLVGKHIWDSGRVLSQMLLSGQVAVADRRVLELGAGTGISGLTAAAMGANVILTDQEPLLPLLQENIDRNDLADVASAAALAWGDDEALEICTHGEDYCEIPGQPFDLIIGTDVLYNPDLFDDFLKTLVGASTPGHTEVLLAYPQRFTEDIFLEQAANDFEIVSSGEVEPNVYLTRMQRI